MNSTTAAPGRRSWMWLPPGVVFYATVAFAVIEGLWVSSIQSLVGFGFTVMLWFSLAGIWIARIVGAALATRLRFGLAESVRWLMAPVILAMVYLIMQSGLPFDARLSLSRAGMDQAAAEVMAGGTTDRDWIGLWAVEDVDRIPGGMRFIVMSGGLIDHWGFAYSETGGRPAIMAGEDSYSHLDGNWWIWTDGF